MQILTWNTQWCCGLDGRVDVARIVDGARALGPFDVLCLQEVAVNYPGLRGGAGDQVAELQALLPGWQLFFGAAVDEFTAQGRQRFGNLIATCLPVGQVQHLPLPWPADASVSSMPRMCTVVTVLDPQLGWVRVMSTHLEYYSKVQRMAQARALRALHRDACTRAAAGMPAGAAGSPFQAKPHTLHAVLCGDFNLEAHEPEYTTLATPWAVGEEGALQAGRWWDSWDVLHPGQPQPPTFKLYDRTYGPHPVACDFVWVSDSLRPHVRTWSSDSQTQASDHQPVLLGLA